MEASARATGEYLGLKAGDSALLCLPTKYVAGRMMEVRAEVLGLKLIRVEPSKHPLAGVTEHIDFAAFTPLQVYHTLQVAEERAQFAEIQKVIIGGGPIDHALEEELKAFNNEIYSTCGMTETLSHIAMRRIGEEYYTPLPGVEVTENETLIITAPRVCPETLITNDMGVVLPDGRFKVLGRRDNTINSGGVKVQAEEVERLLGEVIKGEFMVCGTPDEEYGEAVTLVLETPTLPKHWRPKKIVVVDQLPRTETGKVIRKL